MKAKNIVLLGIILMGLLAYIVSFEIPRSEKRAQELRPFHNVAKGQVAFLEIKKTSETVRLVNSSPQKAVDKSKVSEDEFRRIDSVDSNQWKIDGLAYPAVDPATLNSIMTQISAYELGEPLPSAELDSDLSVYGLNSPEVVLTSARLDQYGSQKQQKFEFGKRSDFLGKRYVRFTRSDGSSGLFLTDELLFFAINKPLKDFRRKDPIAFSDSEFVRIELLRAGESEPMLAEKRPSDVPGIKGDRWKLLRPVSASADQSKISDLLRNLRNLKIKEVYESDQALQKQQLLDSSASSAALYRSQDDSSPLRVKVASEKDGDKNRIYFSVSNIPAVFEAEADTTAAIFKDLLSYRQSRFFEIEADDVQSFDLSGSWVVPLKGEKKDDKWKIAEKDGDEAFIRQWLMDVNQLKAADYPSSSETADFGFSNPTYRLSLKISDILGADDSKSFERVLVVGKEESSDAGKPARFYAAVDNLSEPFVITAEDLSKITPKAESLLAVPTPTPSPAPAASLTPTPNS